MRSAPLLFPALLLAAGCATTEPVPIEDIYQQQQQLHQIWPGYHPVERGVGFYFEADNHVLLVLDTATPPQNFTQQSPGVWRSNEPVAGLQRYYYVERPLDDITATLVRYSGESDYRFNTLFHEDFHGYQGDAFSAGVYGGTLSRFDAGDFPLDVLVASLRTERGMLMEALAANNGEQREAALLQYASLRLWREQQLPESTVTSERQIETHEGTASWVGYKAEYQLHGRSSEAFLNRLNERLKFNYEEHEGDLSARLMIVRAYATGSALSELLSIATGTQWQSLVEQEGTPLFELLLNAYDWPQAWLEDIATTVIEDAAFERAVARAGSIQWPAGADEVLAQVVASHGWKLTLHLPGFPQAGFSAGSNAVMPLEDGSLLLNPVTEYTAASGQYNLEIRNLPFMNSAGGRVSNDNPTSSISVFLKQRPAGMECAADEPVCEGTTTEIDETLLKLNSQVAIKYRLENLHR